MGFFLKSSQATAHLTQGYSKSLLHKGGCAVCPLNGHVGGKMKPTGSDHPVIYMLGEAPGKAEVKHREQFIGPSGRVLRDRIPISWKKRLRWNNCARTRPFMPGAPSKDRPPSAIEVECCRPSVIADIEKTKPRAIFGFGNVPLAWALEQSGITKWNGRYIPVKIGTHSCWFFPMLHPAFVLRSRKYTPRRKSEFGSEQEFVFARNLEHAFDLVESLPAPEVWDRDDAFAGVDFATGGRGETDVRRVLNFLQSLYSKKKVGIDYETNRINPYGEGSKILTVALSTETRSFAFPLDHPGSEFSGPQRKTIWEAFSKFLHKAPCLKISHNLAFELKWSGAFFGSEVMRCGKWEDTMSQAYVLDERIGDRAPGCLALEFLCLQYFGINVKKLSPVNRKDLEKTPVDDVLRYNAVDAKFHRALYVVQRERILNEGLNKVGKHQLRRVPTLVMTQDQGVPISQKRVEKFHALYTRRIKRLEEKISAVPEVEKFRKLFGTPFRPTSNADVKKMITKVLKKKIPPDKQGKESVNEAALVKIKHELISLVLRHRKANKLLSTYVMPVRRGSPLLYEGSRIHPQISTTATETWRTSSDDPNIQNWPKRKNKEVRKQVRGPRGTRVVSFDYASIQARNVAMESKDPTLVDSFRHRYDIHSDWMQRIVRVYPRWIPGKLKDLDPAEKKGFRHRAKNEFVFPSFFGAKAKSLSGYLGIPIDIVEGLHDEFWDMFPEIADWHKRLRKHYKRHGYVTGLSGFRRRAPISPNQLINAPIQADEAIIVMDAMNRLSEMEDPRFQPCLMVHDDLTFIWDEREVDANAEVVISTMLETPFKWARIVPLGVEMAVGKNWAEQEAVGEYFSDTWSGSLKR